MTFAEKLTRICRKNDSLLCVGLDSDWHKLPRRFQKRRQPQLSFNRWIIRQTAGLVCAYKFNLAFYEARGSQGWQELKQSVDFLRQCCPGTVTIADAKRADIGSSNEAYAEAIFDNLGFDAITLHPYLGGRALRPFLKRKNKGCFILCHTSNPGARELQELESGGKPLWQTVAEKASRQWNRRGNCMLVVGATYPRQLAEVRKIVGGMTLLVPGIGAQGGNLKKTMKAGLNSRGLGMNINSSRGIIFASDPEAEAEKLRRAVNGCRRRTRRK